METERGDRRESPFRSGSRPLPAEGPRFAGWHWTVPAAAGAVLVASCWLASARKPLWMDEILTRILLGSPGFGHMIRAISDGVDSSPPLYLSAMWVWTRGAGLSELSLRLFSCLATGAAFLGAWVLCRRLAGFWPATLAASTAFFLNAQVFAHSFECRNYSLFVALTALALLQLQRMGRSAPVSSSQVLLYAGTVAMLVMTHLFGFLITGILLLALIASDVGLGRFRPPCYLATPAGWIAFLPWIPSFQQQSKIGEPRFWIPKPPASVLWDPATFLFGIPLPVVATALVLVAAAYTVDRRGRAANPPALRTIPTDPVLLAGPLLVLLVPLATWVVSVTVKPIWLDRYQLPALLGWCVILAGALRYAFRVFSGRFGQGPDGRGRSQLLGLVGALGVAGCLFQFYLRAEELPDERKLVDSRPPMDHPVATQFGHYFLFTTFFQPRVDVYFVLDWPSALANSDPGYVTDFNIMSALRRNFPELKIVPSALFLSQNDQFYFWDKGGSAWIAADPRFREERLGSASYRVERIR